MVVAADRLNAPPSPPGLKQPSTGIAAGPLAAVGSGFTYQGRLIQNGNPANGPYDMVFSLYDALAGGSHVGNPSVVTMTNQTVSSGLFTVSLDFGNTAFLGDARWLEIAVRQAGVGNYGTLAPRQPLSPSPNAMSAPWLGISDKPLFLGPVLLNVFPWILEGAETDVFAVSQMPLVDLSDELLASLRASGLLWVIEEHRARGGLGEHLTARMAQDGVPFRFHHTYAVGYPDGLYGSQSYHQTRSGLDPISLQQTFQQLSS